MLESGETRGDLTPDDTFNELDDIEDELAGSDDLESTDDEGEDEAEGPPLIYVLNLVNTKQDQTVKRYVTRDTSVAFPNGLQRCDCESHGDMYPAFIFTYI
jgi:hypothetical protein